MMNKEYFEKLSKKLLEQGPNDPVSNLLSLLATPEFMQYMDSLSNRLSDQEFMAVKNLYDKLYQELKKYEI